MKQIVFLSLLIFISCGSKSKKDESPLWDAHVSCALTFMNKYIEQSSTQNDIDEWVQSNDMTTASFRAEYQRIIADGWAKEPEMGLGFDPILNSQDCADKGYELDFVDDKTSCIHLKGKGEDQFKVVVKVIKKGDKCLVDGAGVVNMSSAAPLSIN